GRVSGQLRGDPGLAWLLRSNDPSVRYLALTEVLGRSPRSRAVRSARTEISHGRRLRALLSGQRTDGGFGVHWYKKWAGTTWRLVSAVELAAPPDDAIVRRAAEHLLAELPSLDREPRRIRGRFRLHASVIGNPLGVCARLGMADDPRVRRIAHALVRWQWPDGGWNCDGTPGARHSSFYESLAPLWGLSEYRRATHDPAVAPAIDRAAELFLRHRLFRSCHGNAVMDPRWTRLHYPLYWHYDILQALRVLDRAGRLADPRAREALDLLESKRAADGTWRAEGRFWRRGLVRAANTEVVDWGRDGPNEMITLNALRVLVAAGRLW
ncbi:MAG TPA: hypothetical protein VMG36_05770, partial [Thermoplasmata archaeon]|nr:hypothetical protein [Thermoplasmata archaeon]